MKAVKGVPAFLASAAGKVVRVRARVRQCQAES